MTPILCLALHDVTRPAVAGMRAPSQGPRSCPTRISAGGLCAPFTIVAKGGSFRCSHDKLPGPSPPAERPGGKERHDGE